MLKKHRKHTFTMALIVGIATISLATLGYSVWVAGIQNNKASTDTTVSMDFAVNNTVIATAIPTKTQGKPNTITIDSGNTVSDSNNPLGRPNNETSQRDLNNSMQLEVIASNNAKINKVDAAISIKSGVESRPDLNIVPKFSDTGSLNKAEIGYTPVKINESDTKDIFNRPLTNGKFSRDYTFLDLSQTSILGTAFTKDAQYSLSGYSRYIYNGSDFSFKFGTFFNNDDPETFYNPFIIGYRNEYLAKPTENNKNTYLKSIQAATDELNLMYRIINGSTINVTFTVDVTFNN